jgi:hypothetical protein
LITLTAYALNQLKQPCISRRNRNWDDFRCLINERLTLEVSLKSEGDIEAEVNLLNYTSERAGSNATLKHTEALKAYECLILIKIKTEKMNSVETVTDC